MAEPATGREPHPPLLAAIPDPQRRRIDATHVAIVVAHPDDETVGCGALLARLTGATLVLVTDGAPANAADAHRSGFAETSAYAATRRRELESALSIVAGRELRLVLLGVPDQQAALRLVEISQKLFGLFRSCGITTALTHAYEGGHPDHDATAFAVHAARRRLMAEERRLMILEMPYYRLGSGGMVAQSFVADEPFTVTVHLTAEERARKACMLAAHATQQRVLADFGTETEQFRPAPDYDFTALPNEGALFYALQDWGMTGEQWRRYARTALAELGITP